MNSMDRFFVITGLLLMGACSAFGQLSYPESAVYDGLYNRYLVSNVGNNTIYQIQPQGEDSVWVSEGLTQPKGMVIENGIVYVTNVTVVKGFNLNTGEEVFSLTIEDAEALNDIESDGGYLYVSDFTANVIFRIDIEEETVETWAANDLDTPNGLLIDPVYGRLLIVSFRDDSPIQAADLETGVVSDVLPTTGFDNFDGMARDGEYNVYISCWGTGSVYRYDDEFTMDPVTISEGHDGPADICFNIPDNYLVIPNLNENTVSFVYMGPPGVISIPENGYDFGQVELGDSASWMMEIENHGEGVLVVREVESSIPEVFYTVPFDSFVIAAGGNEYLEIRFRPQVTEGRLAVLDISSSDPETPVVNVMVQGSGIDTDVPDTRKGIPDSYRVSSLYPNPFNPETTLEISLPGKTRVHVELFDVLGRRIKTLAAAQMEAGYHQVHFDGSNLATGIYLIRVSALGYGTITRKATLVK